MDAIYRVITFIHRVVHKSDRTKPAPVRYFKVNKKLFNIHLKSSKIYSYPATAVVVKLSKNRNKIIK